MLINVKASNFLSFEEEVELTMNPSNKTRKKMDHKVNINNLSLLKYAVIYGANASGKSNLVSIFSFIQYCLQESIPINASTAFCKNRESNKFKPSNFEIQFTINEKFYAYGFSLILSNMEVQSEWLYQLYKNGSSKVLFERENGKKPEISCINNLKREDKLKIQTYIEDFDEKSNKLFLSIMNKGKKYKDTSKIKFFKDVFQWLSENIDVYEPYGTITDFEYYYDDVSLNYINKLINTFDTGITEVNIKEIPIEELKEELPVKIFERVMNDLKTKIEEGVKKIKVTLRSPDSFFNIELLDEKFNIKVTTIKMIHGKSFYDFKFSEESDGTRRLFELLHILLINPEDKIFIIDEMERSLHPKLISRFIELFDEKYSGKGVQLIFTTHESSIMDQELFRRDEIWFVERDKNNNSKLYSLDRFKERYDKKLSKAYLEGRYGAIPIFTSFDFKEN